MREPSYLRHKIATFMRCFMNKKLAATCEQMANPKLLDSKLLKVANNLRAGHILLEAVIRSYPDMQTDAVVKTSENILHTCFKGLASDRQPKN